MDQPVNVFRVVVDDEADVAKLIERLTKEGPAKVVICYRNEEGVYVNWSPTPQAATPSAGKAVPEHLTRGEWCQSALPHEPHEMPWHKAWCEGYPHPAVVPGPGSTGTTNLEQPSSSLVVPDAGEEPCGERSPIYKGDTGPNYCDQPKNHKGPHVSDNPDDRSVPYMARRTWERAPDDVGAAKTHTEVQAETEWLGTYTFARLPYGSWEVHDEDGDDGTLVAAGTLDECLAGLRRLNDPSGTSAGSTVQRINEAIRDDLGERWSQDGGVLGLVSAVSVAQRAVERVLARDSQSEDGA